MLCVFGGEKDRINIHAGSIFFARQPRAIHFRKAVQRAGEGIVAAGGRLEFIHDQTREKQIAHGVDDRCAHDADGGFLGFEQVVDELNGMRGIAPLDRAAGFENSGFAAERYELVNIGSGDRAAFRAEK